MAHATTRGAYVELAERLNRFPQGAPPSDLLYRILGVLVSEREAALLAQIPIRPFDAPKAARIWGVPVPEARKILDGLASRAVLLDMETPDGPVYILPPPMAGFFEFSMMRVRNDVDQKLLGELFYEYITVEDDFILSLFTHGETQLGRVFVNEEALDAAGLPMAGIAGSGRPPAAPAVSRRPEAPGARAGRTRKASSTPDGLPGDGALHVLDHERASEVVETATHMGVGTCYCRHKAEHVGKACTAPMEICMTFGGVADSLIRHGYARRVDRAEGMDLLAEAYGNGLVQFGENVQQGPAFICNCCGCCCEAMIAQRRFGSLHPIHTTNFIAAVDPATCNGCAKCVDACPVGAMALVSANDPAKPRRRRADLVDDTCLGCGVCTQACTHDALRLEPRGQRVVTPVDTLHRTVLMAIERGRLQDCIFDNRALASHRAMAAILGVILRLPPTKQVMASEQMRSRYLVSILRHVSP